MPLILETIITTLAPSGELHPVAEAFLAKMQLFADYLGANAERIAGGGGSGGTGPRRWEK